MNIKSVTLKNFRNYVNETVNFDKGLNVVVGKNASGKTNLVESIYCCALGKSPRSNKYKDLIRWDTPNCYIKVVVEKKYRDYTIEFAIDNQDKKRVAIDSLPLTRLGQLVGGLNIVFFSPDELKLIKDSPQERRRFIDISLSQQSKTYYNALSKYNNVLSQRNTTLKNNYGKDCLDSLLYAWDLQLAKYGAYIIKERYDFVNHLKVHAKRLHSMLTNNEEHLDISYESNIALNNIEKMEYDFTQKIKENYEKDKKLMYTTFGAHRDDMQILSNNIDIRKFGSQGQQRTAALSLKFAEIELFKDVVGESPILLLDDVLSELDEQRRNELIKLSANLQTIITCTDFDEDMEYKRIEIGNGKQLNK